MGHRIIVAAALALWALHKARAVEAEAEPEGIVEIGTPSIRNDGGTWNECESLGGDAWACSPTLEGPTDPGYVAPPKVDDFGGWGY